MFIKLDGRGDVGQQLLRALRAAIAEGRLCPGDRLPSTRDIAENLGVGRNAAIYAYEVLCRERLAESRVGSGTYITQAKSVPLIARSDKRTRSLQQVTEPKRCPNGIEKSPPRHDLGHTIPQVDLAFSAAWGRMLARAAERANPVIASHKGHVALRSEIAAHIARRKGIQCTPEEVLVLGDLPQAISLIIDSLLEKQGVVLAEAPASARLKAHVQLKQAELVEYGADADGVVVPEENIKQASMAFLTPGCNPVTGIITKKERIEKLIKAAADGSTYLVDVDLCADLANGSDPSGYATCTEGNEYVVHVGSIARSVSPLLGLTYVVARGGTLETLERAVYCRCLSAPLVDQIAMKQCLETSKIDRLIRKARREAQQRASTMRVAFAALMGAHWRLLPQSGPWNLLAVPRNNSHQSAQGLAEKARANGLRVSACRISTPDYTGECLILGYAGLQLNEVMTAMKHLAAIQGDSAGDQDESSRWSQHDRNEGDKSGTSDEQASRETQA